MKKNRMRQRLLLLFLTAVMILNMYNLTVLADPEVPELAGDVLKKHIVRGQNPEGAVVNLFDYWQKEKDPTKEEIRDWEYINITTGEKEIGELCTLGISNKHLLRFGQTDTGMEEKWNYGAWNRYSAGKPYQGIVQNTLGADGFPRLNFKQDEDFGNYATNYPSWLDETYRTEPLDYLFSVTNDSYKDSYGNVQGLFQMDRGYYCYDSRKNFAEFDKTNSRFILYDSPGVGSAADPDSGSVGNFGQFFPFNTASEVFNAEYKNIDEEHSYHLSYINYIDEEEPGEVSDDETGETEEKTDYVVRNGNASFVSCTYPALNHYIGMTLEVPFLQTVGGRLADGSAMTFEFSGDDDVWIFIDDVLVADLGGIHDAYGLSINFADGTVSIPSLQGEGEHTLRGSFKAAGRLDDGFSGETFADNTEHTLKMFYLERGHMASNLSLRFNLQNARYNQIKKVDQDGKPMSDVVFALYPAEVCGSGDAGSILCTSTVSGGNCYVKQSDEEPLLTLETGGTGIADFIGHSFSDSSAPKYYILREIRAPAGYRSTPVDIVLEYNSETTMLSVANRWQTGAYASFTAYAESGKNIVYGQYENGFIKPGNLSISKETQKDGLVLAVPLLQSKLNSSVWLPLYGNNIEGFQTTGGVGDAVDDMGMALLEAALRQCQYEEGWYLEWSDTAETLKGTLSDLPGRADRYRDVNKNNTGDMRMVNIVIEPQALENVGIRGDDSAARYQALKRYVQGKDIREAVKEIYGSPAADVAPSSRNVNMLGADQFMKTFASLIYIPNEQRELRVKKVDEDGEPLNGARFGIYESREAAERRQAPAAQGTTASVRDKDGTVEKGVLIFQPQPEGGSGYAKMVWPDAVNKTYYLREISGPRGYAANPTIIPIVVGAYSVYADAGTEDDGVSVEAGVGCLSQNMAKYAAEDEVDITLRDITVFAQEQNSESFNPDVWSDRLADDRKEKMDLHYDINSRMGMNYGLHNDASETDPFFKTETGFLRVRVIQNVEALQNKPYEGASNNANWDNLGGTDLTGLFSLLNVVVVEDQKSNDSNGGDPGDDLEDPLSETEDTEDEEASGTYSDTKTASTARLTGLEQGQNAVEPPRTGDDSLIGWWAVLSLISLLGIGATVCNMILKKRREKNGRRKKNRRKIRRKAK